MTPAQAARRQRQAGFTLIELIIATALGLLVLSALTSVVLTTSVAANTATVRIQASSQVRNFQFNAYDDFALARAPVPTGCVGTSGSPCTTQPMFLVGNQWQPNQNDPNGGVAALYSVRYTWDSKLQTVTREAGGSSRVAASNVTAFSWYIDSSNGAWPTVVVSLKVTIATYNAVYSESQTLRFYPRITATPAP
jgi:prepilin-type N-terminal cleavage/methylation domain-containing protein